MGNLLAKLQYLFIAMVALAILLLIKNWYDDYQFNHSPISLELQQRLHVKEQDIQERIYRTYGIYLDIPVIISDKMPPNLYGLAALEEDGQIRVYLNKRPMQESSDYVVNDVFPHEYAHALMFALGEMDPTHGGHTKAWQNACIALGADRCDRYVNNHDVVMGKLPF